MPEEGQAGLVDSQEAIGSNQPITDKPATDRRGIGAVVKNALGRMFSRGNESGHRSSAIDAINAFSSLIESVKSENLTIEGQEQRKRHSENLANILINLPILQVWFEGMDSLEFADGREITIKQYRQDAEGHRKVTFKELNEKIKNETERLGLQKKESIAA